jgi:hypothetical protein
MKHARRMLRSLLGMTDIDRWRCPSELLPEWDARTELLADLVPAGARVIEFGAGRGQMGRILRNARKLCAFGFNRQNPRYASHF